MRKMPMMIKIIPRIFGMLIDSCRKNHPKKVIPPNVNVVQSGDK
jgi:hypothetical protein